MGEPAPGIGMKRFYIRVGVTAAAMTLGCCAGQPPPAKPDPNATAIHARFGAAELQWIIHRTVGGELITCGYAGQHPFIARSGRVFQEENLAPGLFDRWEDRLCGPDWVKPLPAVPTPS